MWTLSFISEADFKKHVQATIAKYDKKLQSVDLAVFNKNIIDPIKLIFDKAVYASSWEDIVASEIFRQRDKANSNDIGYFHQGIFQYFDKCEIPTSGWDIIYKNNEGIELPDGSVVSSVYVELKNKHNTMNSSSSAKTFIKMQNQILNDDDCACFLVEVIAKRSQNIKWQTRVDSVNVAHKLIRRVSIDVFYALVTGEEDAFFKLCCALPNVIADAIQNVDTIAVPRDTAFQELQDKANALGMDDSHMAMILAAYLLAFSTYKGF